MGKERILVIGAGGQLGSELTEKLREKFGQANVIATDIKPPSDGTLASNGQFAVLDVLDVGSLRNLMEKNRFTQVYHLAAVLSAAGEKKPGLAWKINMDGLLHVLESSVEYGVAKLYWPSSIAVFGPTTPKLHTPQDTIMDPATVYGITKLAGERWCEWYHQKHGLDVRSLRYPGLIGYKAHPGGGTTDYAVDIFFKALTDKRYNCFLEKRTYLPMMYMEDALKATLDLMDAPASSLTVRSSYNVGALSFCPEEIASQIKMAIPDFEISYTPDFRQSIAESWPKSIDDSVARKDWGWIPSYDLNRMVSEMLEKLPHYHNLVLS